MNRSLSQQPQTSRYGAIAITLHWVLGLAIVAMLCMGWYMTGLGFRRSA